MDLCEAHFYIAISLLAQGERVRARQHFSESFKTHALTMLAHEWAWAFLGRMEADPNWPRWLPVEQ
jgi:hypothetical protein